MVFDPEEFRPRSFAESLWLDTNDSQTEGQIAAMLVPLSVRIGPSSGTMSEMLALEVPELDLFSLRFDRLPPLYITEIWQLFDLVHSRFDFDGTFSSWLERQTEFAQRMTDPEFVAGLWRRAAASEDPLDALAFLAAHLWSANLLHRAVAIAGLSYVDSGMQFLRALSIEFAESDDDEVRALGETAFRNLSEHPRAALSIPTPRGASLVDSALAIADQRSILVNGTFSGYASRKDWFWPTSDLGNHIRADVTPDLYADTASFYRWGGDYSDEGRDAAAAQLAQWMAKRKFASLHTVYAHSHGGNVMLDYVAAGGEIELLVLLHSPIINRDADEWRRIASNVARVVVLSTKLDCVVWLDRMSRSDEFRQPLEAVLGQKAVTLSGAVNQAWLSHTHFTKVRTWRRRNIAENITYHHNEVHVP